MRVIEGWHPSDPGTVGYNLLVDGDWLGTFPTLEDAADTAEACVGIRRGAVELSLHEEPRRSGDEPRAADLQLVPPLPDTLDDV
ncbi:MAG TPA: hypothetical protein VHW64_04420 [Nocardioides sp.]|uniref:hypothetical protein n=1 Tax=Nocardioides sp. TaxID=35761 RepID=UPI002E363181|nr:hypothetical protein [Nocardioides sp.]HEX3929922.1 hypothetical protein [Nocardioides sp.]